VGKIKREVNSITDVVIMLTPSYRHAGCGFGPVPHVIRLVRGINGWSCFQINKFTLVLYCCSWQIKSKSHCSYPFTES